MIRSEWPSLAEHLSHRLGSRRGPNHLLLAVASPPRTESPTLAGWPNWLIPAYRAGGQRPAIRLLSEEGEDGR